MLVTTKELEVWVGVKGPKKVLSFLTSHNISFFISKGCPITTTEAINEKLILQDDNSDGEIDFSGPG